MAKNRVLAMMESLIDEGYVEESIDLDLPSKKISLSSSSSRLSLGKLRPRSRPLTPDLLLDYPESDEVQNPRADCSRRWLGFPPAKVDEDFLKKKGQSEDECGNRNSLFVRDLAINFLFLQSIPDAIAEGIGRTLVSLNVASNNLRSLKGLKNLPVLLELKAYSCELTTLEGLEAPKLLKLDVSDNQLQSNCIGSLRILRSLEVLNVDKNKITSLQGVSTLRLKELYASTNQIRNLGTSLNGLSSLETLHMDENLLGPSPQACCFQDLVNLTELSLKRNLLRDTYFLQVEKLPGQLGLIPSREKQSARNISVFCETLPALIYLYLQRNEISKVSVAPMKNLLEINLENNLLEQITDEFVASFPILEVCYIGGNRFTNLDSWKKIGDIETVVEIAVTSNHWLDGLSDASRKSQILRRMPQLQILDDLSVENQETKVIDPLMHCKTPALRYFNESSLAAWETQQLKTLNAIDCQIQKRLGDSETELKRMSRFLDTAERVIKREEELREKAELAGETWPPVPYKVIHTEPSDVLPIAFSPPKRDKSNATFKMRRRLDRAKAFEPIEEEPSDISSSSSCGPPKERSVIDVNSPRSSVEHVIFPNRDCASGDEELIALTEDEDDTALSNQQLLLDNQLEDVDSDGEVVKEWSPEDDLRVAATEWEEEMDDSEVAYINSRKGSAADTTTAGGESVIRGLFSPSASTDSISHKTTSVAAQKDTDTIENDVINERHMSGEDDDGRDTASTEVSGSGDERNVSETAKSPAASEKGKKKVRMSPSDLDPRPLRTELRKNWKKTLSR